MMDFVVIIVVSGSEKRGGEEDCRDVREGANGRRCSVRE